MATFEIARRITARNEGLWCHTPGDAGGETYKGIARNFHPAPHIWRFVDMAKSELGACTPANRTAWVKQLNANLEQIPALQTAIDEFYRAEFWDRYKLTSIQDQAVANWIYDHAVNAGVRGIKWAQEAAGVKIDGIVGYHTIETVNAMGPVKFLRAAEDVAAFYRLDRALDHPSQIKFLPSWLRRDGCNQDEIREVMAMAANGLTVAEVKALKGIIEETA